MAHLWKNTFRFLNHNIKKQMGMMADEIPDAFHESKIDRKKYIRFGQQNLYRNLNYYEQRIAEVIDCR